MAGALLLAVGGIVLAVYLYARSATQAVTTGVTVAERAQVELTLNAAQRGETMYFSETDRFTDDLETLKSRLPNLAWERGSDPEQVGAVYVQVCDPGSTSLLLQMKSDRGNVFAVWMDGPRNLAYYALGPVTCPALGGSDVPGLPWRASKDEGWGGSAPLEIPPPEGGPRRPPKIPTPYGDSGPGGPGADEPHP